jgi:hypothetical protein
MAEEFAALFTKSKWALPKIVSVAILFLQEEKSRTNEQNTIKTDVFRY